MSASLKWIAVATCMGAAAALAFLKVDGWGWFLFVGLLVAGA